MIDSAIGSLPCHIHALGHERCQLMAHHHADATKVQGLRVLMGVEGGLQVAGREDDFIPGWEIVGIHCLGVMVHWFWMGDLRSLTSLTSHHLSRDTVQIEHILEEGIFRDFLPIINITQLLGSRMKSREPVLS